MKSIFDYQDHVEFLKDYLESLPTKERRGSNNRLAQAAGIFPSYLSQIFSGQRQLNLDQAQGVADFLEMKKEEKRYFFRLVERSRAASPKLIQELNEELQELKSKNAQISSRVSFENFQLRPEQESQFYSSWVYAAVRLATDLPAGHTKEGLSKKLNLPVSQVEKALKFLLKTGLCIETEKGYGVGPAHTHLKNDSPAITSHHRSWRLKAMENYPHLNPSRDLSYSLASCISETDAQKIREQLLNFVAELRIISDPSPSEKIYCFNLDWLQISY
jgi:uncharacterized protein (TIGR02147 family)